MGLHNAATLTDPTCNESDAVPLATWRLGPARAQVVLTDAGVTPWLVADSLQEVMSITLPDPGALEQATPIVLFRDMDNAAAEELLLRLQLAGALVDLRPVHTRRQGIRSARTRRVRQARAA